MLNEGVQFDQSNSGILHFYKNKSWNNAINAKDIYESNGCGWNLLTSRDVHNLDLLI